MKITVKFLIIFLISLNLHSQEVKDSGKTVCSVGVTGAYKLKAKDITLYENCEKGNVIDLSVIIGRRGDNVKVLNDFVTRYCDYNHEIFRFTNDLNFQTIVSCIYNGTPRNFINISK